MGFLLYTIGYLLAILSQAQVDLSRFLAGYLIFGLAHLSASFSNDYFDRFSDKYSEKTLFSGGSKVLVNHPELEKTALKISVSLLIASGISLVVFVSVYQYSFWFLIFSVLGGLTSWFYTAPPLKLAYRGLGELTTMLAVGFLMPGMGYFVASGTIALQFMLFVLPLSFYGLFFIITVELPDLESDRLAHKKNIVVLWGRKTGRFISIVATAIGTFSLAAINFSGAFPEIDLYPIVFLSIIPLIAAIVSLVAASKERRSLVRQVMINMGSMVIFSLSMNLFLLSKI